jgi:PKD repeat protein
MTCRMKRILVATLTVLACSKAETPVHDAGVDRLVPEVGVSLSDAAVTLAVDFAVEDCASFDPIALTCTGTAPLTVRFVPLATTTVASYLWDLGLGETSYNPSQISPSHTYNTPGTYSVSVAARGPDGQVVSKKHDGFIVVVPNPIGGPCGSDAQCDDGLFCLCPSGTGCVGGPIHGLCTAPCQSGICDDGSLCAGLDTAPTPIGLATASWQKKLCLQACAKDSDCAADLHCRTLPPGPKSSAWIHGCFADMPADIGEPCVDTSGNLRDDLCASGLCANLGAKGLCTMNCSESSCPPGSDCAVLGDGRKLCLRPCTGAFTCSEDPLLTCVQPNQGDLGYYLVSPSNPTAASTYCAPWPCISDDTCQPTGTCVANHCVARK